MFVLLRIYAFKRRCGLGRWQALRRAVETTLRDFNLKGPRL